MFDMIDSFPPNLSSSGALKGYDSMRGSGPLTVDRPCSDYRPWLVNFDVSPNLGGPWVVIGLSRVGKD